MAYVYTDAVPYLPAMILKVRSTRFPGFVDHYGGVDWELDETGRPMIWHAQQNDVFRRTSFLDFCSSGTPEVVWDPQHYGQRVAAIERFKALEGTPWRLLRTNCEQQIRWAVEGRAYSTQLNNALLVGVSLAGILLFPAPQRRSASTSTSVARRRRQKRQR